MKLDVVAAGDSVRLWAAGTSAADSCVMSGSQEQDVPSLFPEYCGQLVAVTGFSCFPDGGRHGGGRGKRYVVPPPSRSARVESFWIGRLAVAWSGEPVIDRLEPVISEVRATRRNIPLSEALRELFPRTADQRVVLHIGTAAVLTELHMLHVHQTFWSETERRVALAIIALDVRRLELGHHAPNMETLMTRFLEADVAFDAALAGELLAAEGALSAAQEAFALAERRITDQRAEARQRQELYRKWLDENPAPEQRWFIG